MGPAPWLQVLFTGSRGLSLGLFSWNAVILLEDKSRTQDAWALPSPHSGRSEPPGWAPEANLGQFYILPV